MENASVQTSPFRRDCPVAVRQAVALLLLSVVAAAALWLVRDDRLGLRADAAVYELEISVPVVDPQEALAIYDEGMRVFIDTRSDEEAGSGVIPGSFPIRAASFDDDLWEAGDFVYPEDPVLLYGGGNLGSVSLVADLLLERGFQDVLILRGGLAAWRDAGGEISEPLPKDAS